MINSASLRTTNSACFPSLQETGGDNDLFFRVCMNQSENQVPGLKTFNGQSVSGDFSPAVNNETVLYTLTTEEINVALLLIEGKSRSEITRSLHLSSIEANNCFNSLRKKISAMGDSDPVIAAAITEYKLTRREVDILRCIRREMTNIEIAAELFLSEETVKTHVRNLLKKLKIASRKEIWTWEESLMKDMELRR